LKLRVGLDRSRRDAKGDSEKFVALPANYRAKAQIWRSPLVHTASKWGESGKQAALEVKLKLGSPESILKTQSS
jgi:hypothetical protein